ncbi:restriction endonuclease subunit S [Fibrobacter succinogenes]|uniref:restriction endonuclease subunit S n=1 Tax=Fibrobacter succinogenes TaxID=833 RepID=UPI00156377E2|nr:restriction endonuclease subunit S [Fibrobacter succinogenes]
MAEWKKVKLEDVALLKAGKFVSAQTIAAKPDSVNIYPCFGGNGVRGFVPNFSHEGVFPIIGRQGALCGNVNLAQGKFYATEHAVVASPQNGNDSIWLYYALFYANLNQYATGQAQPGISVETINKVPFLLPPIEEQKKIAATLSVWDSAIEKMEKLIEAKECGHAVLMNEMLKNSKTWSCTCLSDMATIKKGKQLNAVDMISDGAYYVMNGGITPSGNTDDWNTAENTISISEGGNSCGFVAFNKEKFWAGGHCYTLIDLNENISVRFLFHYLKNMEKEIMAMRVGSGLPNIQKDSISDIRVLYPSKKEQERISNVLDDSLSEIILLKQQLENYKKQKQGLMQKLLTGQWRVK